MYENLKEILKPKDVAAILKVSTMTLRRWDADGQLPAFRTTTDRRYYTREQILAYLNVTNRVSNKVVIYARESSIGQRAELKNQVNAIKEYCNNNAIIVDEVITDIGSGLNYDRKAWNKLLIRVENLEISKIIISYKDRFIRFGFEWFREYCRRFGCEIVVVNENTDQSPEDEMIDDLISIINIFSCKIHGLRKYKRKEDLLSDSTESPVIPDENTESIS